MDTVDSSPQPDPRSSAAINAPYAVASAGPPSQVVYVAQSPGGFRRWASWLGWMGCLLCISIIFGMMKSRQEYYDLSQGVRERYHSGDETSNDKVAVIKVEGVIGAIDEFVKKQIDRVREDDDVKAVVVRVDSPGGTITGSDYIYHHLLELQHDRQIPLVVSMGSVAASGGYYVAMAVADQKGAIFAEPTTTTGSIGVIIPHYDISGLLERMDVKDDSLVSHPRKRLLSMTRPIQPEDRGVLEAYLQDAFTRFKTVIKAGRPVFRDNEAALNALATGEIFTATQAKTHGLVDELGFIEDAIERAAELANLDVDKVRVVTYKAPTTLVEALTAARAPTSMLPVDWNALMEMSVPKAYYLSTTLPLLARVVN